MLHTNVQEQIDTHLASLPPAKRQEVETLHALVLQAQPAARLWFDDGTDENGKVVTNPTIGYGHQLITYANGNIKDFFRIGISANKTGITVYIMGIKEKTLLANTFSATIGKASITSYCIKFKKLADVNIDVLASAVRLGLQV